LKLPSPFTLTVRASTDYVKVFPEQLPESERLAGLVRYPRMSGLCWPLNVPVRENRASAFGRVHLFDAPPRLWQQPWQCSRRHRPVAHIEA